MLADFSLSLTGWWCTDSGYNELLVCCLNLKYSLASHFFYEHNKLHKHRSWPFLFIYKYAHHLLQKSLWMKICFWNVQMHMLTCDDMCTIMTDGSY